MPFQNRVTPLGELIATPERGLVYGNRGRLHDEHGVIRRQWQVKRWISCRLEFRGRHRAGGPMAPNRYTGLFFLDEATALAAGHRPCAECRNADYQDLPRAHGRLERRRARRDAPRGTRAPPRIGAGRAPRRRVRGARGPTVARPRFGALALDARRLFRAPPAVQRPRRAGHAAHERPRPRVGLDRKPPAHPPESTERLADVRSARLPRPVIVRPDEAASNLDSDETGCTRNRRQEIATVVARIGARALVGSNATGGEAYQASDARPRNRRLHRANL